MQSAIAIVHLRDNILCAAEFFVNFNPYKFTIKCFPRVHRLIHLTYYQDTHYYFKNHQHFEYLYIYILFLRKSFALHRAFVKMWTEIYDTVRISRRKIVPIENKLKKIFLFAGAELRVGSYGQLFLHDNSVFLCGYREIISHWL